MLTAEKSTAVSKIKLNLTALAAAFFTFHNHRRGEFRILRILFSIKYFLLPAKSIMLLFLSLIWNNFTVKLFNEALHLNPFKTNNIVFRFLESDKNCFKIALGTWCKPVFRSIIESQNFLFNYLLKKLSGVSVTRIITALSRLWF